MRFLNKRVFITGASRGIGAHIANSFREEGAYVVGTQTKNNDIKSDLCDEWFITDFSDENQVLSCAKYLRSQNFDILVNNAGFNINEEFALIDLDVFKKIQQVNLFAPFVLCQAVIGGMEQKGWGRIVNISSIWGKVSKAGRAAYSASKFGLDGLTISLSAEYSSRGIMANCVAPGFIDTSLTRRTLKPDEITDLVARVPAARLGSVEEVSKLVLWLSSEENTFTTGQNIAIDGGFTRV
jgi:NAD(P)-dependent dehydrogenase (short-subunit alcohol dehydrogenase family)